MLPLSLHTLSTSAHTCTRPDQANAAPEKASGDRSREWRAAIVSQASIVSRVSIVPCSRLLCARLRSLAVRLVQPRSFRLCLMKNTHDLCFKFPEFDSEYSAPWMQDQIAPRRKQLNMPSKCLAHASLDAIPFVRLAQHFARRQPHAWPGNSLSFGDCLRRQKPAHRRRLPFAARGVSALIVGMLLEARASRCLMFLDLSG